MTCKEDIYLVVNDSHLPFLALVFIARDLVQVSYPHDNRADRVQNQVPMEGEMLFLSP